MDYTQLLQFLHLSMLHFRTEILALIGDDQTIAQLVDVQLRLNLTIPSMIVSVFQPISETKGGLCPFLLGCPVNQITLVWLAKTSFIFKTSQIYYNFDNKNRIVLLVESINTKELDTLTVMFGAINAVIVGIKMYGIIEVWAWGMFIALPFLPTPIVSRFDGPDAIFHSQDPHALAFANDLQRLPGKPAIALIATSMLQPYVFILNDLKSNRFVMVSSMLNLYQMIGYVVNFEVHVNFNNRKICPLCFVAFLWRNNRGTVPVLDFKERERLKEGLV